MQRLPLNVGTYLDYQDLAARQWSVIKILEINRDEITFEFDGWPKKWNTTCKLSSKKLMPFRFKSSGYTGPKENAIRDWTFRPEEVQFCEDKLKAYTNGSLSPDNPFETTQFLRGELFTLVDNLLVANYRKNEHLRVISFFTIVVDYIVEWLKKATTEFFPLYYDWINSPENMLSDNKTALAIAWPELLITLKRIFGLDPRTSRFHRNNTMSLKDYEPWYGSVIKNNSTITSYFVNIFGKKQGFDIIISLLSQNEEKNKIPFEFLKEIPFFEVAQYFDKKLNDSFTIGVKDLIIQRIESISLKELKELNKDVISEVIYKSKKMMSECLKKPNLEDFDKADLSLILKFFRGPYMEKRLRALNEIKELIERAQKYSAYSVHRDYNWPNSKQLAEWIVKEQILQQTFAYSHAEMMKRVSDIVVFLNKHEMFNKNLLDLFWESAVGKHDSVIIETHKALMDLADYLKTDMLMHLYKKIKQVSFAMYDEKFLKLARDLVMKLFNSMYNSKIKSEDIGIELFLPILNDTSSIVLCDLAIDYLLDLIRHPLHRSKTEKFLQLCIEKVSSNTSVPQYLKLFQLLISQSQSSYTEESLKQLDQSLKIIESILQNFKNYMKKAPEDPNTLIEDKYTHKQNIEIRLKVISCITKNNVLNFNSSHFSALWSIFVDNSRNLYDSEMFFVWLQDLSRENLSKVQISEIFTNFLCKIPVSSITLNAYECFKIQFLLLNMHERNIEVRLGNFYNRLQEGLIGLETLYTIAIRTRLMEIHKDSSMFIAALNLRLNKSILPQKTLIWSNFIQYLLNLTSLDDPEIIIKVLNTLQNFLEENYVIGNSANTESKLYYYKHANDQSYGKITVNTSDTIRSIKKRLEEVYKKPWFTIVLRIGNNVFDSTNDNLLVYNLPVSKTISVEFQNPRSEDFGPKQFLSQNEGVQNLLFNLLSDHQQTYAHEAWTLLTSLTINESIKESLTQLKTELSIIIDQHSLYKMLYCLLIIKELIQDDDWVLKFKEKNGFEYIIELFQEHDVFSFTDSTCMKYSTVMIFLIEECFKFTLKVNSNFVQQLFDCLIMVGKFSQDPDEEKIVPVGKSAKNIFSEICRLKPSLLTEVVFSYPRLSELLETNLIICSNFQYSNIIMNLFLEILGACEQLLPFITNKLFELVPVAVNCKSSISYWNLLTQCVSEHTESESIGQNLKMIRKILIRHNGETNSKDKSIELCGLMSVVKAAIDKKLLEPRTKFLQRILEKFLFNTSLELNLPKCKNEENRKLAFEIIEKSLSARPKCVKNIVRVLSEFHCNTHWRTKNIYDWNYSPASEEKSVTGFVGLKNIGNICYMNSTLQQLFNIPTFCEELLRCPIDSSKKEESIVNALQFIFSGLKNSAKQYMSPKKLCVNFKDWEGRPINVLEQMDADEFFNNLMDKLENEMKGTNTEHSIRNHFGGIQITECIGKDQCSHKSERAEDFMTLPIQVKNKKSILDSLESFVEGEILEGDNAYECDYCETKVTALRRVCLKHLPNILIIALRRFEFDFDTMNRVKVNDYCEFPMEIDMEPYTQEGLERKEQKGLDKKFPEDYYRFQLKGITIHTGTAETGHYYSFIQNRNSCKWFEFNDVIVNSFDPEDIPAEAFGGVEKWNNFYSSSYLNNVREKYRNAYLLFYEREHKYCFRRNEDSLQDLEINLLNSQQVSFQEVVDENDRYWRCKSIFSIEYFNFVSKLLRNSNGSEEIVKFCAAAFLVIFIRSKDLMKSGEFLTNLESCLRKVELASVWVCELICVKAVYKELIVDCPIEEKGRFIVEIIASCFENLGKEDLCRVFNNFLSLFSQAAYARNNGNYFRLLHILVKKGPKNVKKNEMLGWILRFLEGEEVQVECAATFKLKDVGLGYDINFSPAFEKINDDKCPSYLPVLITNLISEIDESQSKSFFNKQVMRSLTNVNHKLGTHSVGLIYTRLILGSKDRFKEYLSCLLTQYKETDYDRSKIYFRQLKVLIESEEYIQVLQSLTESAKESKNYLKVTEVSVDYILKLCIKYQKVKDWFLSKSRELKWIENWLKEYTYNARGGFMLYKKPNMVPLSAVPISKSYNERAELYKKIVKNSAVENIEWDSDDEFPLESIENNNAVDVFDPVMSRWVKGYVMFRVRSILAIKLDNSNDKTLKWYSLDSEYLAPDGSKVIKFINRN